MVKKSLVLLGCIVLIAASGLAEKKRDWQTGTVLDSDRARNYAGSVATGSASGSAYGDQVYGNTSSTSVAIYKTYQTYVIESGKFVYVANERLRWKWSKPANLTVNGPVRFAIEKNKIYILGEDEKEHEAEIVKKILKVTDEKEAPNK